MAIDTSSKRSKPLNGMHLPRNRISKKAAVQPLNLKDIILDAFSPYRQDICGLFLYGSYAKEGYVAEWRLTDNEGMEKIMSWWS